MKKIAVLGSSGGNLYNSGGKNPKKLLGEIKKQAQSAEIEIKAILFIGANSSMDNINKKTKARLYTWDEKSNEIGVSEEETLKNINKKATEKDSIVSKMIKDGKIDGLILISCDPEGVNKSSIEAAVEKNIPIAGTGGTSMANVQSMGGNVISTSGTTGTTNRTRAVASIQAFSNEWDIKYKPTIGSADSSSSDPNENILSRISFRGIMMAALPGFIAMAITLALSKVPAFSQLSDAFDLLIGGLPIIIAAIAAKQISGLDEVGIVAGIVAGILSKDGGIIGGLVGGIIAGLLSIYLLRLALKWKFPGTTANIVSGGVSGLIAGFIVFFLISPITLYLGDSIRGLIEMALNYNAILAGALAGFLIWPAIIGGVYHAAILPLVLLEMENTGSSFLGAIDMTGLVMVSAGITLANIIYPKKKSEKAMAIPGFLINIGFGTFVEAAYPFMFSDKIVFGGAMLSGAISGAFVGLLNVRGTAYVPSITAPFLSNNIFGFLISMLIALGLSFTITVIANKIHKNN